MAIVTNEVPYELLIRWDTAGTLQGAQFQKRYVIKDGESVLSEAVGPVEPIDPRSNAVRQIMAAEQAKSIAAQATLAADTKALAADRAKLVSDAMAAQSAFDATVKAEYAKLDTQRVSDELTQRQRMQEINEVLSDWIAKVAQRDERIASLESQLAALELLAVPV